MKYFNVLVLMTLSLVVAVSAQEIASEEDDLVMTAKDVQFKTSACTSPNLCAMVEQLGSVQQTVQNTVTTQLTDVMTQVANNKQELDTKIDGIVDRVDNVEATANDLAGLGPAVETLSQTAARCTKMGMAFNASTGSCFRADNTFVPVSDSDARCASRKHEGNVEYSGVRDVIRVCRVDSVGPHWVEVALTERKEFVMNFPKREIAHYSVVSTIPTLSALSMTMWIKSEDTAGSIYFVSYATSNQKNNELLLGLKPLTILRNSAKTVSSANLPEDIFDGKWHHFVYTWDKVGGKAAIYKDGGLVEAFTGLSTNVDLPGGGSFIIGQEQDLVGGGFDSAQTFSGSIGRMNMYSRALTDAEVKMSYCNSLEEGDVKRFVDFSSDIRGALIDILPSDIPLSEATCPSDFDLSFGSRDANHRVSAPGPDRDIEAVTIAFWVRSNQKVQGGNEATLLAYKSGDSSVVIKTQPTVVVVNGEGVPYDGTATDLHDGQWHHMAFTWDSNSGTIHVFLDGGAVAQGAGSLELVANNGRFTLGQDSELTTGQTFQGRVSQLNIYSRVLPPAEIRSLMCGNYPAGDVRSWTDFRASIKGSEGVRDIRVVPSFLPRQKRTCPHDFDVNFGQPNTEHYLQVDNLPAFDAFSITLWFNSAIKRGGQFLVSYLTDTSDNSILLSTDTFYFSVNNIVKRDTQTSFHDGKWHHIVFQWDTTRGSETWVDGEPFRVEPTHALGATITNAGQRFLIGQEQDRSGLDSNQRWNGRISQFNIFDRMLTADEVKQVRCGDIEGNVRSWADLRNGVFGTDVTVELTRLDIEDICDA